MEYSPFSIYVLRNSYVIANGEKQNIINHIRHSAEETGEDHTHVVNHMFEKYYIDRYINAQTAEDMLTERMALAARIAASTDEEEKQILQDALAASPLYVLDPIAGKMYKAGENYIYDPTIVYNNEPIDLREIQRYDLDNLDQYFNFTCKTFYDLIFSTNGFAARGYNMKYKPFFISVCERANVFRSNNYKQIFSMLFEMFQIGINQVNNHKTARAFLHRQ